MAVILFGRLDFYNPSARRRKIMRIVVAALCTLSLLAGLSGEASARAYAKKGKKHVSAQVRQPTGGAATFKPDGHVERDANRLPFGSSLWWEQMMRESRAGTCCN